MIKNRKPETSKTKKIFNERSSAAMNTRKSLYCPKGPIAAWVNCYLQAVFVTGFERQLLELHPNQSKPNKPKR